MRLRSVGQKRYQKREQLQRKIETELESLESLTRLSERDLVRLPAELSQRLRDWKGLLGRHPAQARQIARNLVDGRLTLTNCRAKPVGSTR